jgi:tetratricopeptide (TPR) repeat protein
MRSGDIVITVLLAALLIVLSAGALAQSRTPVKELIEAGMAEIEAGRPAAALAHFERCLAENKPPPWQCSFHRAIALLAFPERRNEAVTEIEKIALIQPNDLPVHYALGRGYVTLSKHREAIRAFSRVLELDPKFKNALVSRATSYYYTGLLDDAISDISVVILMHPKDAKAYDLRASFYGSRLDLAKALPDLTKAIELDPSFAMPLVSRANIYALQDKYDLALTDINRAILLDPSYDTAFKARAAIYCNLGKKELANADERRVIELGGKVEQPCKY